MFWFFLTEGENIEGWPQGSCPQRMKNVTFRKQFDKVKFVDSFLCDIITSLLSIIGLIWQSIHPYNMPIIMWQKRENLFKQINISSVLGRGRLGGGGWCTYKNLQNIQFQKNDTEIDIFINYYRLQMWRKKNKLITFETKRATMLHDC